MSRRRAERVLDELTRELRSSPSPELDWAAIESRLPKTPAPDGKPHFPTLRLLLSAAAFAAVAAALSFRFTPTAAPPRVATQQEVPVERGPLNGDLLQPGTEVSATTEPKSVEHATRATWTLSAGSRASIVSQGEHLVVRLEQGSVRVQVVPSHAPETFAVEAADVRVAAHGTVFEVSLAAEGVGVDVSEGKVLVGPRARPGVGKLLESPSVQHFSLAGDPLVKEVARAPERVARNGRPAEPELTQPQAMEESGLPEAPEAADIERITLAVVDLAAGCFSLRTVASDGVKVTAHTTMNFFVTPEGSVSEIGFDPPLAPSVQACVSAGAPALHAVPTRNGFGATQAVDFER